MVRDRLGGNAEPFGDFCVAHSAESVQQEASRVRDWRSPGSARCARSTRALRILFG